MSFNEIIGQEKIIGHMKSAIRDGKISHAYIICGEKGSGKKMLAREFAMAIQCEEGGVDACGQCKSCKQAMSGNHPDIRYVTHEKPNVISVDEIRVQLNSDIEIKPYASKKKIYIIDEAEKMNVQAQNAMLKTIEEPPEYAVIILLVTNSGALLQTILSRCIMLNVRNVDSKKIRKYLVEKQGISEYMAELSAGFSDGVIGKAVDYAASDDFINLKNEVVRTLKSLDSANAGELFSVVKSWSADKNNLASRIDLCEIWFRDALVVKTTDSTEHVLFKEEEKELRRVAEIYREDALMKKTEEIKSFRNRLKTSVSVEASLMLLLLAFRDN